MKPEYRPLCIVLAALIIFHCAALSVPAQGLIPPLVYPEGKTGHGASCFIWQDMYQTKESPRASRFRITVKNLDGEGKPLLLIVDPRVYYNNFFVYELRDPLAEGRYEYTIERMLAGEALQSKYYHYLRYPIKKNFTVDGTYTSDVDGLLPPYKIQYMYLRRQNILENGYNSLFFAGSAAVSFGIGMLFYAVVDWGIVSTILYVIAFTSSAVGFTASGYYGYRYVRGTNKLQKILEIGGDASLKGGLEKDGFKAEIEKRF